MVRAYPTLKREYDELHHQRTTESFTGLPGSRNCSRSTEDAALRTLPRARQRELDAVNRAIELTRLMKNGDDQIRLIDLVYWKKSHNIAGSSMILYVSEVTGKRWHTDFIRRVGFCFGLEDAAPYPEGKRLKGKNEGKTVH